MIARALHALGFGQKSMPTAIATNDQALRAMTASRDDWKRLAEETGERFKLAATDLAKQADRLESLKSAGALLAADRDHWREQALRDQRPAQMWRNSLKRSRDRKQAAKSGDRK